MPGDPEKAVRPRSLASGLVVGLIGFDNRHGRPRSDRCALSDTRHHLPSEPKQRLGCRAHNRLGRAYQELGLIAHARAQFEMVTRLDPGNAIATKRLKELGPAPRDVDPT